MTTTAAVRERPILFSGPMVRAILDGTKTQTRRVVKPQPNGETNLVEWNTAARAFVPWRWNLGSSYSGGSRTGDGVLCPYGAPGDRLWVREAWGNSHAAAHASDENAGPFVYRADGESTTRTLEGRWRPSIHMPRRASRLTLEVTGVRVKRLQDISEEDALAEGIPFVPPQSDDESGVFLAPGVRQGWGWSKEIRSQDRWAPTAGIAYRVLWDSINAKRAPWDSNPWVWVVEFQRLGGAA